MTTYGKDLRKRSASKRERVEVARDLAEERAAVVFYGGEVDLVLVDGKPVEVTIDEGERDA